MWKTEVKNDEIKCYKMGLTRKLEGIASSARVKFPIFNGKMSWISYLKPFKIAGELINGYKNQGRTSWKWLAQYCSLHKRKFLLRNWNLMDVSASGPVAVSNSRYGPTFYDGLNGLFFVFSYGVHQQMLGQLKIPSYILKLMGR